MDSPVIAGLVFSAISVLVTVSTYIKNNSVSKQRYDADFKRAELDAQRARELSSIFLEYERRFTKLETQAELWHKAIERDIGKMIHSPHRPALDALIEKNDDPRCELTREEAKEMVCLLDYIMETEKLSAGEKFGMTCYKASLISRFRLEEFVA